MAEEKKHVAMMRCEFDEEGGAAMHSETDCNGMQLLVFVGKTLELAAKLLNWEPDKVAEMALFVGQFSTPAEAEDEK